MTGQRPCYATMIRVELCCPSQDSIPDKSLWDESKRRKAGVYAPFLPFF